MEYTIASVIGVVAVVLVEVLGLRTGVLTKSRFWIAYGIVVFFQVLVDGWLTKLSAPIVIYSPDEATGLRFPWDVPVEDYLFGFALIALTIMLWEKAGPGRAATGRGGGAEPGNGRTGTAPTLRR